MSDETEIPAARGSEAGSASRRRLIKTMLATGAVTAALPERWIKPVVDSVVVPVHAQASPGCPSDSQINCPDCLQLDLLTIAATVAWDLNGADNEVGLSVSLGLGDSAAGSATVAGSGDFSGSLSQSGGNCPAGGALTQSGTFSGHLNTTTGAISGVFEVGVFCGGAWVCNMSASYSGTAVFGEFDEALSVSDTYQACCEDTLNG
jgi:hypothetical protein